MIGAIEQLFDTGFRSRHCGCSGSSRQRIRERKSGGYCPGFRRGKVGECCRARFALGIVGERIRFAPDGVITADIGCLVCPRARDRISDLSTQHRSRRAARLLRPPYSAEGIGATTPARAG
jgi:hypothetical protein